METLRRLAEIAGGINLTAILDIALVSFVCYQVLMLLKGTRAVQLVRGLLIILIVWAVTQPLPAMHWLINKIAFPGVIALVIIFQPELRIALERIGRGRLWGGRLSGLWTETKAQVIAEVVAAVSGLADKRTGALIAIERDTGLEDVARTGHRLDAAVSAELLETLFAPRSPLHDGAVIVTGTQIVAAGCTLPHSMRLDLPASMGMRHRAALGLSERTDAAVVVVSEETGSVSLAFEGHLESGLRKVELSERLLDIFQPPSGLGLARIVADIRRTGDSESRSRG
jgi:diadenylate cyclase